MMMSDSSTTVFAHGTLNSLSRLRGRVRVGVPPPTHLRDLDLGELRLTVALTSG